MPLKDTWTDKVNGVDDIDAAHINEVAGAVIELEENSLHTSILSAPEWSADSTANATYHVKALRYALSDGNLNVDFDVRISVKNTDGTDGACFRYPCNMQRPFADVADGTAITRIIFRVPRIIFEEEDKKTLVTYFRAYEKAVDGSDTERELWFEIKTADGYLVNDIYLAVMPKGGTLSEIGLVQKDYDPYVGTSGYDSLTVYSADWANKTTNLNISSRAAAPYATASGNDSRAEGEAGDVGGIGNKGSGKADLVRGEDNTNSGDDVIQSGKGNTNTAGQSLQEGNNNHNEGYSTVQVGNGLKNYGGNAAQFGHTNENHSQHILQTGYKNTIPAGCDYASTIGTQLKAARRLQSLHGQYNEEDARALALWANGTSSAGKNVFAIPEDGVAVKDYDGINLAFLQAMIAPCGKLNTPNVGLESDGITHRVSTLGSFPTDAIYLFYNNGVLVQATQKSSLDNVPTESTITVKVIALGYLASDMSDSVDV